METWELGSWGAVSASQKTNRRRRRIVAWGYIEEMLVELEEDVHD